MLEVVTYCFSNSLSNVDFLPVVTINTVLMLIRLEIRVIQTDELGR